MMRSSSIADRRRHRGLEFLALACCTLLAPVSRADVAGVAVHGFVDVGYLQTTQQDTPSGQTGFRLGTVDLYLSPQLSDRVKSLMEVVWEFDSWNGDGQPATDIERMQIGYTVNDEMTVWVGRFHTPYGYWNTAYHHGAQLQPSILRPAFLAFEDHGGILPAHTVGAWLTGHHKVDDGRITYDLYTGNGSRILPSARVGALDMSSVGDSNGNHAVGGRLGYQFENGALDGLWIGVHALKEEIDAFLGATAAPTSKNDVQIAGGFLQWDRGDLELIGEYYHFDNKELSNNDLKHSSSAGFVHLGYTLQGRFTPYLRYESGSFDQTDPYFSSQDGGKSYRRSVAGVRYDIDPSAALKVEGGHTDATRDGGERYNEFRLQLAVRF